MENILLILSHLFHSARNFVFRIFVSTVDSHDVAFHDGRDVTNDGVTYD